MEYKFGGKYLLEEEIANGGCGTVYLGTHHIAGKPVAIKLEPASIPGDDSTHERGSSLRQSKSNPNLRKRDKSPRVYPGPSPLTVESQIYKRLCGAPGVPYLLHSGKAGPYNVMILDLLGPSLDDLFKLCNRSFSIKTICLLADQLLERIEFIHRAGLVHRDIKPANFVMGRETGSGHAPKISGRPPSGESVVNVIDFGLAKKFRDGKGMHIPYSQRGGHGVGTSLFAAINTHLGVESSRRDDLEALTYMLVYFLRGTLPWRKIRAPERAPEGWKEGEYNSVTMTWDLIRDAKLKAEPTLCDDLPPEFDVLYRYSRTLAFDDLPDYEGLRDLFRGLARRVGVDYPQDYDGVFDWTVAPSSEHESTASALDLASSTGKGTPLAVGKGGRFCEACRLRRHAQTTPKKIIKKKR